MENYTQTESHCLINHCISVLIISLLTELHPGLVSGLSTGVLQPQVTVRKVMLTTSGRPALRPSFLSPIVLARWEGDS